METSYLNFRSARWSGKIHKDWIKEFQNFDCWLEQHPGISIVDFLSRKVRKIEIQQGCIYLKRTFFLTVKPPSYKTFDKILKWFFRPSTALAVLNISQQLQAYDFLCPEPVLAVRRRSKLGWPEDIFISKEVKGPTFGEMFSQLTDEKQKKEYLEIVAKELFRFHQNGFIHGDFLDGNFCIQDKKLLLFDNERTIKLPFKIAFYAYRNLCQFGFHHSWDVGQLEDFSIFLKTYLSLDQISENKKQQIYDYCMKIVKIRLERLRKNK